MNWHLIYPFKGGPTSTQDPAYDIQSKDHKFLSHGWVQLSNTLCGNGLPRWNKVEHTSAWLSGNVLFCSR